MRDLFAKPIDLREYQVRAVESVVQAFEDGSKAPLLVCPTGSGKTTIAVGLIEREISAGGTALFLAPRRELVAQATRRLRDSGFETGVVLAGADYLSNPRAHVQVASIDTLLSRQRHGRIVPLPDFSLVIVDEAHLGITAQRIELLDAWPSARRVGLTATPVRRDGRALGAMFDLLIESVTVVELQATGYLSQVRYWAPTAPDLRRVRITGGDYNGRDLDAAVNRIELIGDVVTHWLRLASDRPTVVFATSIQHSLALAEQFLRVGVTAEHVDATTPIDEREAIFERFKRGSTQVLTNCFLASYGFDFPSLSAVVLARPTRSLMLYLQMVGRGLRAAPGKADCVVLDHAGCVLQHGFAHDSRNWTLDGHEVGSEPVRRAQIAVRDEPRVLVCPECTAMFRRTTVCPECGHRIRPKPRNVHALDVELVQIGEKTPDLAGAETFFRELLSIAKDRQYSDQWAAATFHRRFGKWPPYRWNRREPLEPTLPTLRWVKSRQIAWAKSRMRRTS